jgi:hypothetical protein
VFNPLKEKSMATLLIETKVVKALQVQIDDVEALLRKVHKKEGLYLAVAGRGQESLKQVGRFVQGDLSELEAKELQDELSAITGLIRPSIAFQDLVNRRELPEGAYLLNLGQKEEHDGGQVKDYVLKLQAEIAKAKAVAA